MEDKEFSRRVQNAAASQAVENCHARHTYLHAKAYSTEEWSTIWSKSEHISWAHFFGRMRGQASVWYGSVSCYDAKVYENYLQLFQQFPEMGGKDPRPLNEASVHALVNDIIEVAADGKSARSVYITPGVIFSNLNESGKRFCNYMWERYGSDYVCEDGQWVYLHEQVCPDVMAEFDDQNWAYKAFDQARNPHRRPGPPHHKGGGPAVDSNPICQDGGPLHQEYSPLRPVRDTVPYPVPYATMDNNNTYTPFLENPEVSTAEFLEGLRQKRENPFPGPGGPGGPGGPPPR